MQVSPWLAPLMTDYTTVWCPQHLGPYQPHWPLGAPTATVYLVEAAAGQTKLPDGYELLTRLVELSPLCCWVNSSTVKSIHEKTVPR
jgi:hypothetical protein